MSGKVFLTPKNIYTGSNLSFIGWCYICVWQMCVTFVCVTSRIACNHVVIMRESSKGAESWEES